MKTSKIFIVVYFCTIIAFLIYLFKPFLLTVIIGMLMAVSTANLSSKILKITDNRKMLSASIVTALLCILFMAPFIYAVIEIAKNATNFDTNKITSTINYIKDYNFDLPDFLSFLEPKIKEIIEGVEVNSIASKILKPITSIGKSSAGFLIDMGLIIIFYFFSNLYATELFSYVKKVVPIKTKVLENVLSEVANTTSVVFYSTIINAILQGICFGIIAEIYGYDGILMAIIFSFSSLVPVVGGALIYIPVVLFEFAKSDVTGAIIILLYSVIFISTIVDNFFKPLIIKFINSKLVDKPANVNEMLIFFAMISGIATFGFWGIILGPAIVTFFIASVKVLINLNNLSKEKDIEIYSSN